MPFYPPRPRRRFYRPRTTYRPRRTYRRAITNRGSHARYHVPRSVGAFRGEHVIRKMKYVGDSGSAFQMTSTAGALATDIIFRANDLRDPNQSGVGGQPRTFDEIMALYRNFMVLGSKITLDLTYGTGSATSSDMLVSCILKDGATGMADAKDIMEHPRNKYVILSAENDRKKLVQKFSWRILGQKSALDNSNAWGNTSSSPVEQFYYHINAYAPNGATEVVSCLITVEYTAIFFHAIQPSAS